MQVFLEGFLLQASLIFALGAQNIFVLESGLKKQHPVVVSFVCFLCDLTIILLGVAGAATLFTLFPQVKVIIGVIGVLFLFYFGWTKFTAQDEMELNLPLHKRYTLKQSILKSMAFSLLNPHAYLDGIVLIGGYSSKYDDLPMRLGVGLGAACFSLVWFLILTSASSSMKPLFSDPKRMRFIMCSSGAVLIFLSGKLSMDVYGWIQETPEISALAGFNSQYPFN
jgi:L-lysine exporter family protein LysE/ArgO